MLKVEQFLVYKQRSVLFLISRLGGFEISFVVTVKKISKSPNSAISNGIMER